MIKLDDDEKGVCTIDTLGGKQEVSIINESGLYSLVLTSRKPQAKRFKKWLTSEVIPAIRKTGVYSTNAMPSLPTDKGLQIAKLREQRTALEGKLKALESQVADTRQQWAVLTQQEAALCNSYIVQNKAIADEVMRCEAIVKQAKQLNPFISLKQREDNP